MSSEHPGSAQNTEALKAAPALAENPNVTRDTSVPMGSRLAAQAIDPRLKPGTRAHRVAMLNMTAEADPKAPLDPGAPADPEGEAAPSPAENVDPAVHGAAPDDEASAGNPDPSRPWEGMRTHAAIDDYVDQRHVTKPEDWSNRTLQQKKDWLGGDHTPVETGGEKKSD